MAPKLARNRLAIAVASAVFGGAVVLAAPSGAHVADWAHNWNAHIKPRADQRYYTKTQSNQRYYTKTQANSKYVAKSATVRGTYAIKEIATESNISAFADISFGVAFPSTPTTHVIRKGGVVPAGCSGSPSLPSAARGHLCIFEQYSFNVLSSDTCGPAGVCPGASRFGTAVRAIADVTGPFQSMGTWAATPK